MNCKRCCFRNGILILVLLLYCTRAMFSVPPEGWNLKDIDLNVLKKSEPPGDCSGKEYLKSRQSCCGGTVYDIPEKTHAQCCNGVAYWKNDTGKPHDDAKCWARCGSRNFNHKETELCCGPNKKVWWVGPSDAATCCGDNAIILEGPNKDRKCCADKYLLPKDSGYECCDGLLPYHSSTMMCNVTSLSDDNSLDERQPVTLKPRQRLNVKKLCNADRFHESFVEWDAGRPLPAVQNSTHQHIRAWVRHCKVKVFKSRKRGRWQVSIPLTPFFTEADIDQQCEDSETLTLTFKLGKGQDCNVNTRQLREHLDGKTVDVFFGGNAKIKCRKGRPILRLKERYNAVIYLSEHSNAILAQSLGLG